METILFILLVAYIISWIVVLFNLIFAKRLPKDTVQCYTGSLGQGKTYIGVRQSLKYLKINRLLWFIGIIKSDALPLLYSNIPIIIKNGLLIRLLAKSKGIKLDKFEHHITLEFEHVVMLNEVVEYSVIFIDELGQFANQYSHDNPFVMQYLQQFVRFYRHFIDGKLIITDQVSDNITKPIRTRIGVVYNLTEFHRFLFHWFKVNVIDVRMTEDIQTINSSQLDDEPYYFGHLPYKYFKWLDWTRLFTYKKYESRCYKPLYEFAKVLEKDLDINGGLFTKYVIDLPNNAEMKKQFRKDGFISQQDMQKYVKDWLDNVYGQNTYVSMGKIKKTCEAE